MKLLWSAILCAALAAQMQAGNLDANKRDQLVLETLLQEDRGQPGYSVVPAQSMTASFVDTDEAGLAQTRRYVTKKLGLTEAEFQRLFQRLLERNRAAVQLSLSSAPDKGYVIETATKSDEYVNQGAPGWLAWLRDHPDARDVTRVSLPAYDAKTGLILVHTIRQKPVMHGAGYLVLYKWKGDKLVRIGRVTLWVC